jgi:hypothetical protein
MGDMDGGASPVRWELLASPALKVDLLGMASMYIKSLDNQGQLTTTQSGSSSPRACPDAFYGPIALGSDLMSETDIHRS